MRLRPLTGVLVLLLSIASAHPALAKPLATSWVGDPNCPHNTTNSYGSTACILPFLSFDRAYIIESNFTNSTMSMPGNLVAEGDFILHGLWALSLTPYGNCKSSIEQDYIYGYNYHSYYEYVFARTYYDYPGQGQWQFQSWSDGITSTGASTKFQNQFDPASGQWKVWRNDSLRYTFPLGVGTLGSGGACIGQAGLELRKRPNLTGIEPSYVSYTHTQNLSWYDTTMTLRGWGTAYSSIDYPCNLGQVPPNCLNGVYNSTNQWADNKP